MVDNSEYTRDERIQTLADFVNASACSTIEKLRGPAVVKKHWEATAA